MLLYYVFFFVQDGNTALHLAASNNKTEIVNLLIRMGCNLNLQNEVS